MRPAAGFTLVEVMVSVFLFTLILGGLYTTLVAGNLSWQTYEAAVLSQQNSRRVITVMSRDFRVARNMNIDRTADGLTISFYHPKEGLVEYSWNQTDGKVVRQGAGNARLMAQHISALAVDDLPRLVRIQVTCSVKSRGEFREFSLAQKVAKRF